MNEQWQKISDVFGSTVVSFCKHWRIVPVQTKNEAFYINDEEMLQKCKQILAESMHFNETANVDEEINRGTDDFYNTTNYNDFIEDFDNFVNCTEEEITGSVESTEMTIPLGSVDGSLQSAEMKISSECIDNILQKINISISDRILKMPKEPKFSKAHILEASINGKEIFQYIMDFYIDVNVDGNENCISLISSILEYFQKCHKRFNYYSVLMNINQITKKNNRKTEISMPIDKIKKYFELIFDKVVPLDLFGNHKNKNKIQKAINKLLNTGRYECITLKSIINKIKIADIIWLRPYNNFIMKQLVFAKVVYWFFTEFIKEILRTQFYITNIISEGSKKSYIPHSIWKAEKANFIHEMKQSLKIITDDTDDCSIGDWILLPKLTGVRPILRIRYSQIEKDNLHKVLRFLEQLYITHYNRMTLPRFYTQWKTTVQYIQNSTQKRLYIVSCDVTDAYGSINCEKLFEIVKSISDSVPDNIRMELFTILNRRDVKSSRKLMTKRYFVNENLQFSVSPHTLFSPAKDSRGEIVKKDWLMNQLKHYIFNQKVRISNEKYLLVEGLLQGAMLSAVLCDIYYSHMVQYELSEFLKTGTLYRYVDDFLYVTDNQVAAKGFLYVVKNGINTYNCRFKPSKTHTNLYPQTVDAERITYLGYYLNMNTLEMTPKYPDMNTRYTITLSSPTRKKPAKIFQTRLKNIASLKLTNIALDDGINSMATILETLRRASLLQASRCLTLILRIFVNISESAWDIFKAIKFSNNKIVRIVRQMYMTDKEKQVKITKELKYLLWNSYKKVFNKRPILYKTFNWLFTREISRLLR